MENINTIDYLKEFLKMKINFSQILVTINKYYFEKKTLYICLDEPVSIFQIEK